MAIPLKRTPAEPQVPHTEFRGRARAAIGAGLAAFATAAAIVAVPGAAIAQDDTLTSDNSWATDLVQAPAAWETTQGEGITVAVVDSGIGQHPFFEDKDILPGYSIFSDEEDGWNDATGHGSQVAAGVLYVAPKATILPVRIDTGANVEFGGALGEDSFDTIKWAADNGADILVMPWGIVTASLDENELEAIQYAIDKGTVVIAAAGNDPGIDVTYPASVPGVVAVSGTDTNGNAWYGNTTGPEVVVAAPAEEMTHPLPQDPTQLGDSELYESGIGGTSVGSGIVGGVAALTWAAHPELDASNVIQRLIQTAGDGSGSNRTEDMGFGLVNAADAVNADGIDTVEENPLGYPMGEAGASGASPDEDATEETEGSGEAAEPSAAAADDSSGSDLSTIIVIAAAVILIGAAVAVWLVLRGRGRKAAATNVDAPGPFSPSGAASGNYQQPAPTTQQYGAPSGSGQGFGGPPPGPQGYSGPPAGQQGFNNPPTGQGFNPPAGGGEPSPPWGPSDPNNRHS